MNDAEVLNTSQSTGVNGGCFLLSLLRVVNGVNNTLFYHKQINHKFHYYLIRVLS